MPIIKSAKKRVRVAAKATSRNRKTKRTLKTAFKSFHAVVTSGGKKSSDAHAKAQSALDKAVKKGIVHKNKAARQKKQLAAKAKAAAGAPKTAAKKTVKKAVPKKTATKKPAAKKPATKKTTKK